MLSHDLPNEHSMALPVMRPVQCLHALVLPCGLHSHSLQLSFFFLPRRRNVAQLQFPQTVNLPPQSRTFRLSLERHASELAGRLQENGADPGPCRHRIDSLAFIIPFSSPPFVFSPARHALRLSALSQSSASAPCFKMLFQGLCVDVGDIITVSVALNYHIYPRFIC